MTDSQAAADPKRSAWVSANAGAGKTYTLANRVTRLLLDGAPPERILCLTYTKAAAAEMAGRLFEQLGQWAMMDDRALAQRIVEIGAGARDVEGLRVARRLFASALETPGGLKIQTIHSFCQYLLARFPLEAGVPPAFRVLDDETGRELRDAARSHVLERAGRGEEPLASATALLATEAGETQLHAMLGTALGGARRKLERFLAQVERARTSLSDTIRAAHGAHPGDTAENVAAEFLAEAKRDEERLREIAAWLAGGSAQDVDLAEKLSRALAEFTFASFNDLFLVKAGTVRKKLATKGLCDASPENIAYFSSLCARFAFAEERRRAAHAASLADAALALIAAVRIEYDAAKRARSALDYDDLIMSAQRLLERQDAAQWVLYKLDGGLDHVLIDEAQDTSPEQWAIVKRLTEEFFAGKGTERDARVPRTIFAVGDEKQSIFSFQGAEPSEFDFHRRYFAERIAADAFVDVRLDVSRRSLPEVLRYVDQVFADADMRQGVVSGDIPIAHRAHRSGVAGRVELWPVKSPSEVEEPDIWRPVDAVSTASPVALLANEIANRIKDWVDGGKCLPGKTTPIRPGDIMVLMPRREPFASALIRALKFNGIPVAGADRIRLSQQIAVMDLIALGRFALLPEDDLNLAALLRSPLIGLSEDALSALSVGRPGTLWQSLVAARAHDAGFAEAEAFLSETRARADLVPPYEFYAAVLSAPGMRARLLTRLGVDASDAIDEFLSLALSFEALNTPSIERFLHWVEQGDAEVKRDMERSRDEVRVMTVHGAKGLEADIVILPDTASLPGGGAGRSDILYTDDGPVFPVKAQIAPEAVLRAKAEAEQKIREEHRRLLYVALTRARDRLYICGFKGTKSLNPNSWYALAERAARAIGEAVPHGGETALVLGDASFAPVAGTQAQAVTIPELKEWSRAPAPLERARPRLIRPSEAAGEDEPAVLSPTGLRNAQRFRRGNLVHALLAHLPDIARETRRAAAEGFLAARGVAPDETHALVDETLAVIDAPEFAAAFSPGARAEVAIVAELPELGEGARVNGRIDRLAVGETDILAVDFKTNRPPPERVQDVPKIYVAQMALYRAALAQIFPGRHLACALVWTEGPSLMHLPASLLDAEIDRIAARLSH